MSFEDDYKNLIIKQYWEKTNASAEIGMQAGTWESIFNFLNSFLVEFDIDSAFGEQLDIIGRIVGIKRRVPYVKEKNYFGFDDNSAARSFGDLFSDTGNSAPLFNVFSIKYTDLQLDDPDYRFFIKLKVAKNMTLGVMATSKYVSIVNAVFTAFDGHAYVDDNKDMSLTLYVDQTVSDETLRIITALDLLPKPQGVRYEIVKIDYFNTFGFDDNAGSKGFANKFDLITEAGGEFAEKVI